MKLQLNTYEHDYIYESGLKHYKPKAKIQPHEIEIDFILTFVYMPQFSYSDYFSADVSEPEVLHSVFTNLEKQESDELIKISMCAYTHGHDSAAAWVEFEQGKRWFNQDKNTFAHKKQ